MRIVLLGSTGQVGWEARRSLATLGEVTALDYPVVDFTQPAALVRQVRELRPQIIYNAAAYTAVDQAEGEPETALLVNATAVGALAETARRLGAVLVHFSTDYVFDGQKEGAYQEDDEPNPCNAYGKTKLQGELAVRQAGGAYFLFRTAWVYSTRKDSFVSRVLQWARDKSSIRVVTDQVSSPTWARSLAEITAQVLARGGTDVRAYAQEHSGLYHLAGTGAASRLEWAEAILRQRPEGSQPVAVLPALTAEFPSPAQRPLRTVLDCALFTETFHLRMPPWQEALQMAMEQG